MALFNLIAMWLIWGFQVSSGLRNTPRYLIQSLGKSLAQLIYFEMILFKDFWECWKIINSVLDLLEQILLELNQLHNNFKSISTCFANCFRDLLKCRRFVSSAKWWTCENQWYGQDHLYKWEIKVPKQTLKGLYVWHIGSCWLSQTEIK